MAFVRFAPLAVLWAVCPLLALDTGLLPYVDPDATAVAGVYVDRTTNSKLADVLTMRMGKNLDRFVQATGLDPRRDLREVMFVAGVKESDGLFVARGTFQPARLGRRPGTHAGVPVYQARYTKGLLAFPEPSLVLFGDDLTVRAALDRRGKPGAIDPQMLEKMTAASGRFDIWFAAKGRPGAGLGLGAGSTMKFDAVDFVSGGATLGATVNVTAEAVTRSQSEAEGLANLLKFVSGMAEAQQKRNPEMGRLFALLNHAQTRVDGSTVVVTTWAHEEDLAQVLGTVKSRGAGRKAE